MDRKEAFLRRREVSRIAQGATLIVKQADVINVVGPVVLTRDNGADRNEAGPSLLAESSDFVPFARYGLLKNQPAALGSTILLLLR